MLEEVTAFGIVSDFVAPSTSGLNRMPIQEQLAVYAHLKQLIDRTS